MNPVFLSSLIPLIQKKGRKKTFLPIVLPEHPGPELLQQEQFSGWFLSAATSVQPFLPKANSSPNPIFSFSLTQQTLIFLKNINGSLGNQKIFLHYLSKN